LPIDCRIFKDKVLPSDNVFHGSCEEAKQLLKMLGVEHISYHACLNGCILYRGEYADKDICLKYGNDKYNKSNKNGKLHGDPHNILRHMSIIQRIQILFCCKELPMLYGLHASHRSESGVMRIPTYSIAMNPIEDA
jgi:hypothetical protein